MDALLSAAVEAVALAVDGCTLDQLWGSLADAAAEAGVQLEAPAVRTALWRLLAAEPGIRWTLSGGLRLGSAGAPEEEHVMSSAEAAEAAGVRLVADLALQDAAVGLHDCQLTRFSLSDAQRKALAMIGASRRRGALQNDLAAQLGVENRNFFYVIKVLEQRGLVVKHPLVFKRQAAGRSAHSTHVTTNILHLTRFAPPGVAKRATLTDGKAQAHGGGSRDAGAAPLGEDEVMVLDEDAHCRRICEQLEACSGQQANESELKVVLGFRGVRGHRLWRRLRPLLVKRGHIEEFLAHDSTENKAVKCVKLLRPWKEEDDDEEEEEEEEEGQLPKGAGPMGRQVAELSIDRQLLRELVAAGMDGLMVNDVGSALRLNMKRNEPRLKELETRFGTKKATVSQGRMITSRFTAPEALLHRFQDLVAPLQPAGGWLAAVAGAIEAGLDEGEPFPWPPGQEAQQQAAAAAAAEGEDQQQQQQQQQQEQQEGQQQQQQQQEKEEEAAAAAAAGAMPAALRGLLAGTSAGTDPALPALALAPGCSGAPVIFLPEGTGQGPSLLSKKIYTELSQRRLEWVAARINRAGFMLASEMPRFLMEQQEAETGKTCTMPDRKTCDRVIERGQMEGAFQVLAINVPATYGGLSNRTHTVLAAPGIEQDEAFVEAVYQHYESFRKRAHGFSSRTKQAALKERQGKVLPIVDLKPLLPGRQKKKAAVQKKRRRRRRAYDDEFYSEEEEEEEEEGEGEGAVAEGQEGGSGGEAGAVGGAGADVAQHPQFVMPIRVETVKLMQANGLQIFRLQRLRRLHEACCRLAGLVAGDGSGAGGAEQPAESAAAAAAVGSVFVVTQVPGQEPSGPSRMDMQQVDLSQDTELARRVLTAKSVWQCLTVGQFLHCIGSHNTDTEAVHHLAASGRTMGALSQEEIEVLCGGSSERARSQTRLVQLLDLAYRMGLLSQVLPLRATGRQAAARHPAVGSADDSMFVVRPVVFVQEPLEQNAPLKVLPRGAAANQQPPAAAQQAQQQQQQQQPQGSAAAQVGASTPAAPGAATAAPVARRTMRFDLAVDRDALGSYWARMQFVALRHCVYRGACTPAEPLGRCFPFDKAPEASVERSWAYRRDVTAEQGERLHAFLGREDARLLSFERCQEVARALDIPYEAVLAFTRDHDRPTQRLGRLALSRMGPGVLDEVFERKRAQQRRYYWRRRLKTLQERYPDGIPQEVLDGRVRAGGLPRKSGGGAARKRKQRGEDSSALLPADADDDFGGDEEVQVDQSALLPRPLPVPQRKKKWWKAEDRQLLTAWAGWIVIKGDRPILWRITPGRPANLKHYTLKRRLSQLQQNEELGATLAELQLVALHLRALLVQRAAAQKAAAKEAAEASPAAAAAAATPGDQQQQQQQQASAGLEAAAAAATAGSKRKAAGSAETLQAKKARAAEVDAAVARAAHNAHAVTAAEGAGADAGLVAARGMLEALLPPEVRQQVQQGPEGPFPDAAEAVGQLAQLVEHVVANAPKRHKEKGPGAMPAPGARRRPGPKPLSAQQQQRLGAGGGTQVAARTQSLLRRWAAALRSRGGGVGEGGPAGADVEHPSPAVTAAMAMAQSLLYMGADSGVLGVGYETALTGRFATPDILRAFELLQRQGALLPSTSHARLNFRLTERWRATLQPLGFSPSLFQEAAAAACQLSQQRRLDVAAAAREGEEAQEAEASQQQQRARRAPPSEVTGGTVAALLGGMAAGQVLLRTHRVRAVPQLSAEAAVAADGGGLQEHTAPLAVEVPVRATLAAPRHAVLAAGGSEGSAAGGEGGGGTAAAAVAAAAAEASGEAAVGASAAADESGGEGGGEGGGEAAPGGSGKALASPVGAAENLQFTHQDLVLFQPALVACDEDTRAAAEQACRKAAAAAAGIDDVAFDAALGALRAAGAVGASRRQLAAALRQAGALPRSAGQLVDQLLLHGLARGVCSFEGRRYAASEHSQGLLAFPHIALPAAVAGSAATAAAAAAEGTAAAAAEAAAAAAQEERQRLAQWRESFSAELRKLAGRLGLPPSGHLQPCLDVPVRPWVDHHGRLNSRLWEALVRKALAAVAKHPGMPEELLVEELGVLAPQHARELLRILTAGHLLRVQSCRPRSSGSSSAALRGGGGVLAACFGGSAVSGSGGGEQQAQAGAGVDSGDEREEEAWGCDEVGAGGCVAEQASRAQRFYFSLPGTAFGAPRLLPPAALLPLAGAVAREAGAAGDV